MTRLAILTRENNYSTERLMDAARAHGVEAQKIDVLRVALLVVDRRSTVIFRNQELDLDAAIPRIGASITAQGAAVVRQLESMGVYVPTPSRSLVLSRDKLRSLQILAGHLPMPPTGFVQTRRAVAATIEALGGPPVVIKVLEGTQGTGVILAEELVVAEAIVETLRKVGQPVLIQKFIEECRGRDVRAFVVGDRVVAAARRVGLAEEYRSNVHRGGTAEAVDIDDAMAEVAVRSARLLGLEVAGVDLLESRDGPLLMEVNSSPGIEGVERATGVDVAGAVIDHVLSRVRELSG